MNEAEQIVSDVERKIMGADTAGIAIPATTKRLHGFERARIRRGGNLGCDRARTSPAVHFLVLC